jgi:hypothetical protein
MVVKITYVKKYKNPQGPEHFLLAEEIKKDYIEDIKKMDENVYETKYWGIEDNVLIRLSLNFENGSMNPFSKSRIIIEKTGDNSGKISKIEENLSAKGFSKEEK